MERKESIALYRKYRPSTFKNVLGQEHITRVLEGALKQDNIAHAYLFAGSRGIGKTTMARILAREAGTSDKDMYEIDAASNRGIDDVRALREAVLVLPFESPRKVYIIDEVHMLTKEAFNALLKTLEEPPKHVMFVLATTEVEKLPETIVSRCEVHTFKKPSTAVLKEMITAVAKKEGFTLESAAADLIALLADGSFRDAHGILQKIISSSTDKKVSIAEVEMVTGAPKGELVNQILETIEEGNLKKGLGAVSEAAGQNLDMKVFLKLVVQKMRSVLLLRYAPDMEQGIKDEYSDADFKLLKKMSGNKKTNINAESLKTLLTAYDETGRSHVPELPLELALVQLIKQDA